jgi:hypothetical protein
MKHIKLFESFEDINFDFNIRAGFGTRSAVRNYLDEISIYLEKEYGGKVDITEEKNLTNSIFHFKGTNFTETEIFLKEIENIRLELETAE